MTVKTQLSGLEKFKKNLEHIIRASFACIWVRTQEEDRALKIIYSVLKKLEGNNALLYTWDCQGEIKQFSDEESTAPQTKTKVEDAALVFPTFAAGSFKEKAALAVMDYNFYIDNPPVIRSMKNSLSLLKRDGKIIIFIGPRLPLPEEVEKDVSLINFPLPGREDLKVYLDFVVNTARKELGIKSVKEDDDKLESTKEKLVDAALGLTSQEAEDAFSLATIKNIKLNGDSIQTVLDQKVQILKKEGVLEYIKPEENMDSIGGLQNLKDWLVQRKKSFSKEARAFGLPNPKGILLVGISGCGKSLTAKAAAANWEIGIYRLDVGKIFTKMMGESESNARKVIEVAEVVAPCILWIDEIEKGMAGVKSSGELDSGVTARVTGTLLTWMQEKQSPVFVVATANDVSKLPPELLRKGRFDEVFFVDLPNEQERYEIVKIQLAKAAGRAEEKYRELFTLSDDDVKKVVLASTKRIPDSDNPSKYLDVAYTGAEIEQAVIQASYCCFEENKRKMTADDIINALKATIPLAETMKEDVLNLQAWGNERARLASAKPSPIASKPTFLGGRSMRPVNPETK